MLNVGGGELIIILLVALVVLGPERLPQVARQVGQTVNSLRGLARGFQSEIEAAAQPTPLTAPDPLPETNVAANAAVVESQPIPAPPEPFAPAGGTDAQSIADKARNLSAEMPHEVPEVSSGAPRLAGSDDTDGVASTGDEEE